MSTPVSNAVRTTNQSVTAVATVIDTSILEDNEVLQSFTIKPYDSSTDVIYIAGMDGDDFAPIGAGMTFEINLSKLPTDKYPMIRSSVGTMTASLFFAIRSMS